MEPTLTTKTRQEDTVGGVQVRGWRVGDGGNWVEVYADGAWYACYGMVRNGVVCHELHYGWEREDIDAGRAGGLYREATDAEWAAEREMSARIGTGSYDQEYADGPSGSDEALLELAAENGQMAGAMPADI